MKNCQSVQHAAIACAPVSYVYNLHTVCLAQGMPGRRQVCNQHAITAVLLLPPLSSASGAFATQCKACKQAFVYVHQANWHAERSSYNFLALCVATGWRSSIHVLKTPAVQYKTLRLVESMHITWSSQQIDIDTATDILCGNRPQG